MQKLHPLHHEVLAALFDLAQRDEHATVLRLVRATERTREEVEVTLATLDRAGLVDRHRLRLTMFGLTMAVSLGRPARRRASVARAA